MKRIDFRIVQIDELVEGGCAGCIADNCSSSLGDLTDMCWLLQNVYDERGMCKGKIFIADTEVALSRAAKVRLTGRWDE